LPQQFQPADVWQHQIEQYTIGQGFLFQYRCARRRRQGRDMFQSSEVEQVFHQFLQIWIIVNDQNTRLSHTRPPELWFRFLRYSTTIAYPSASMYPQVLNERIMERAA